MLSPEHKVLIKYIDDSIKKQQFGTLTVTVIVKNGKPIPNSAKLVKMKRRKYKKISRLDR